MRQQENSEIKTEEALPPSVDNYRNDQPPASELENQNQKEEKKTERPPIPLNEYGLPPSLIPLSTYPNQSPYNLQPYPYTNYPLIYDSFGGNYQHHNSPLLPPYNFFHPIQPQQQPPKKSSPQSNQKSFSSNDTPPVPQINNISNSHLLSAPQTQLSPSDIINFSNKNKNIPDVPPPPLPTSRKVSS